MKAIGIVAEYNPLHRGHIYHISESKELTSADVVICAMSGNFVQRGLPALQDKWTRASSALKNGVDVVIEIPTFYCLGSASTYAIAGVRMLEAFDNLEHISFGSETGDISVLKRIADRLNDDQSEIKAAIKQHCKEGASFPTAREYAYADLYCSDPDLPRDLQALKNSNDILAIEYLRAITRVTPITIKRVGAGYNEGIDLAAEFQSATALRSAIMQGRDISQYVPADADFSEVFGYSDRWFDAIRCKALTTPVSVIENMPHGGEGIGNRLKRAVRTARSIDELILETKSKRYTYTHVARLLIEVLLGVERDGYPQEPEYLRVLGFTQHGREFLAESKRGEQNALPIITNVNKECEALPETARRLMELDFLATDIYNVLNGRDVNLHSDKVEMPVIM